MRRGQLSATPLLLLACACSRMFATVCPKAHADIRALDAAVVEFAAENGGLYPESLDVLAIPDEAGFQYLNKERVPLDPWGRAYGYELPAEGNGPPRIISYGSDGKPGGKGDAADLDNFMLRSR